MVSEGVSKVSTITVENSHQSSNADMGKSHEQIHSKQHNYLQPGEPLVEEITNTKLTDNGLDLAVNMAVKMGAMSRDEWNESTKSTKKDTYEEYIASLASSTVGNKKAQLNRIFKKSKKGEYRPKVASKERKAVLRRELDYIKQNKGIPIWSSLFYVGSVSDYDGKSADEIKTLRQAKAETLRTYFNSSQFKELHPQLTRLEIHYDEKGDIHGQGQEVFYHQAKNGRVQYAQRKILTDILINRFGSKQELNRRLNALCLCHREVDAKGRDIGDVRADIKYIRRMNGGSFVKPDTAKTISQAERNKRIEELVRIEDMQGIAMTAQKVYQKYGLKFQLDENYTTDGQHLTAHQYTEKRKSDKKLLSTQKQITDNQDRINNQRTQLKTNNKNLNWQYQQYLKLKDELNDRKQKLDKKSDDLNQREATIQSRESELTTLQQQVDSLTKQRQELVERVSVARKQVDDEHQRYLQTRRRREQEEQAVADLTIQKDTLTKLVSDLTKDLATMLKTITTKIKSYVLNELRKASTPDKFDHLNKFYQNKANHNRYFTDEMKNATSEQLVNHELNNKKNNQNNDNRTSNDDLEL